MQVFDKYGVPTVRIWLSIVYLTYIYRVSIVYLSCIYRICNVVDSGLVAKFRGRHKVPIGRPTGYRLEVKGRGDKKSARGVRALLDIGLLGEAIGHPMGYRI